MKVSIMFLSNKSKEHFYTELTYNEVLRLVKRHIYVIDDIYFDFDIDKGAVWFDMHAQKFNCTPHFFQHKNVDLCFWLHR